MFLSFYVYVFYRVCAYYAKSGEPSTDYFTFFEHIFGTDLTYLARQEQFG